MAGTHSGSCLCGAVMFEVTGPFQQFFLCHCHRCQKGTGSAHAANLFSTEAVINWLSGADNISFFIVEGTRHARSFCKTCGSAVPTAAPDGSLLMVPAGVLDTPVEIAPNAHLCMVDAANWEAKMPDAPKFDGMPG